VPAVGNALRVYGRNTLLRLAGKLLATRALEPVFLRPYYYATDNKTRHGGSLDPRHRGKGVGDQVIFGV